MQNGAVPLTQSRRRQHPLRRNLRAASRRIASLSLTTWAAVLLALFAFAATVFWVAFDRFDEWAPNVATEALSIAVTVAIVERIVRREGRKRLRPLLDRALWSMVVELRILAHAVVLDYTETHIHTYREPPSTLRGIFDHWLRSESSEDQPRWLENEYRSVTESGFRFAQRVKATADLDRQILDPELVAAVDDLYGWVSGAESIWRRELRGVERGGKLAVDPETAQYVRSRAVEAGRDLAAVLAPTFPHAVSAGEEIESLIRHSRTAILELDPKGLQR